MQKVRKLEFGEIIKVNIKDGELSILTKQRDLKPRELTMTSDSTSTDHSTSDQECFSRESLNSLELTTLSLRDTQREELNNSSTSMDRLTPSSLTDIKTDLLTSKTMETTEISE
jgi:hypothetical protein